MRAGWLAVGGIVAALAAPRAGSGGVLIVAAACALLLLTAAVVRQRVPLLLAAGGVLVVARLVTGIALAPQPGEVSLDGGRWEGTVISLGAPGGGLQRALLSLHAADVPAERPAGQDALMYATLPRYPVVAPSDHVLLEGVPEPAPPEPGFGDYLRRIGAVATIRAGQLELATSPDETAASALESLRRRAGELLATTLPSPESGLAAGILIGLRDQVDRDLAAAFTTSGLSHVVAISGWNIALIGGLMAALFRSLPRRRRSIAVVIAIAGYTILAGASPSVVRAAIMGGICLTAREAGRAGTAATCLALAGLSMVLVDPRVVEDAGYRLSLAATAGLLAWSVPLGGWIGRVLPRRTPAFIVESLGISLAAQAATLPIILLEFGRLSLVAPLANLVVAPLVAPAMLFGGLALLAGWLVDLGLPGVLGAIAGTAGWASLGAIVAVARASASIPLASLDLPAPLGGVGAAIALVVLGLAGTGRGRRFAARVRVWRGTEARRGPIAFTGARRPDRSRAALAARTPRGAVARTGIAVSAGLALLTVLVLVWRPDGRLRMTVLDVGQGDAILLEGGRGGRMLVDTGPDPDRLVTLLDARIPVWDRRLDLVVLTHPHEDHVAGLALLMSRYRVGGVAEPGMVGPGPGYAAYRAEMDRRGWRSSRLFAGDELMLDGAGVLVRWPIRGEVPDEPPDDGSGINNVSIVLDIRFGARRMLLTGDVEQETDPALLAAGITSDAGPPLDVLKVAHHGSGTATTQTFTDALAPRVAIISAGRGNPYGHPAAATVARLEASGARVFRTDDDGSVTVATDGQDLQVTTGGARPAPVRRTSAAFGCPIPTPQTARVPSLPRIAGWSSPPAPRRQQSFSASGALRGSWPTSRPSRRWPPSLPVGSRTAAWSSIARSSRPLPSFTTSTSSLPRTTRSGAWATGTPVRDG